MLHKILLLAKWPVLHVPLFLIQNESVGFACLGTCFVKFLTFEQPK
jgi:hypothetical protein